MEVEEIRSVCCCNCHYQSPKVQKSRSVSKSMQIRHLWLYLALLAQPSHALFNYSPASYKKGLHNNGNTSQWAVKLKTNPLNKSRDWLDGLANQIAEEHNLLNHGQVGELFGHYLFTRKPDEVETDVPESETQLEQRLRRHPHVEYYSPQVLLNRQKRQFVPRGVKRETDGERFHRAERLPGRKKFDIHEHLTNDNQFFDDPFHQRAKRNENNFNKLGRRLDETSKPKLKFMDPEFKNQWHLLNDLYPGKDCNVTGVWALNVTGKGVVVAVVDDGVQWNHPDLEANYCKEGSFDLNSNDNDPMPMYDEREENKHGTRCAGEIAAVPNDVCGVGVAFGAKFSGIRVLDGPITDSMEATAFNKHLEINDIYSCSWGPEDDAKTLDGPHPLAQAALIHGVSAGRHGFGSIYIVASGNGGAEGDNCNFDGYANSIYTITIGAVDERGDMPYYAEECASMLASTFSSGNPQGRDTRKIVTTDWTMGRSSTHGCTSSHTGTSAATPLAAGMVALMLQVRPCLTWRDVQHIIVFTARHTKGSGKPRNARSWIVNKAGLHHSAQYGFGLLDAWRLVNAAKIWETTPMLTSFSPPTIGYNEKIKIGADVLSLPAVVSQRDAELHKLNTLEHVQVTLTIEHKRRGDIEVTIVCPSGTESLVGPNRDKDDSDLGFKDWTFSTVRCWGESPVGSFYLIVRDRGNEEHGLLRYWKLTLFGSAWRPIDIRERREKVEESYSGKWLDPNANFTLHCPPGEDLVFDITNAISDRTLKLLALMSGLFVFWSIYYSIEMAFCTADEKINFEPDDTAFLDVDSLSNNSQTDHIITHPTQNPPENPTEKILEKT